MLSSTLNFRFKDCFGVFGLFTISFFDSSANDCKDPSVENNISSFHSGAYCNIDTLKLFIVDEYNPSDTVAIAADITGGASGISESSEPNRDGKLGNRVPSWNDLRSLCIFFIFSINLFFSCDRSSSISELIYLG
jgi:hypothetical protein